MAAAIPTDNDDRNLQTAFVKGMRNMKKEIAYGAVIYSTRHNQVEFLTEGKWDGVQSLPGMRAETEEELIRAIREKTGLEVRLDIVFRHGIWEGTNDGVSRGTCFIAAEALNENEKLEEGAGWQWRVFADQLESIQMDEEEREALMHAAVYLSRKHFPYNHHEFGFPVYGRLWYRENAVDIHSHILAGVDDGAQSIDEGVELLQLDWEEGIRRVFATPHYGEENVCATDKEIIRDKYNQLAQFVDLGMPGMKISLGTEWYCSDDIVNRIREGKAFPMGNSDWYMVEFLEWGDQTEPGDVMLRRLQNMQDNHIHTILAHPERYRAIQQDWELAKRICDLGVLLQVNAYDLQLNPKDATRDLAQWMAKEELISFIGSDMHGTRIKSNGKPARRPQMKEGIRWLYENVDEEYANGIVRINAENLLGVDRLN